MSEELLFFLMRLGEAIATKDRPDIECVGTALYDTAIRHQEAWRDFQSHRASRPGRSLAEAEESNPARTIELDCDDDMPCEPELVQAAE